MGLMDERGLKTPADFAEALEDPGRYGVTDQYVLGYAGALYDMEHIDERELAMYVKAACKPTIDRMGGAE